MAMHTELWFPSVIWSSLIHVVNNSNVKSYAYERMKTDKGRKLTNQGGWQSTDILPGDCEDIDALVRLLDDEMNQCAKQVGLKPVEIYNIWININPPNTYNTLHHHQDAVFSGVYYVDADENQGNILFERNDNAEYHIPDSMIDNLTYFTSSRARYAGKTNGLYIFPGWLKHQVEANKSTKDRISISFNYGSAE